MQIKQLYLSYTIPVYVNIWILSLTLLIVFICHFSDVA